MSRVRPTPLVFAWGGMRRRGRDALGLLVAMVVSLGLADAEDDLAQCKETRASLRAAVRAAIGGLPHLDVLFNNAGINRPQPFLEVDDDALDSIIDINVKAAFVVAQAAARNMVEGGNGGAIINTSSQLAKVGSEGRAVYCASKAAVDGMTRTMAIELGPHNVRGNSVGPTFIETPMTRPYLEDPEFRDKTKAKIPLGRIGQVRDVAGAVVFLASPASGLITGVNLLVDGGWTAI